MNYPTGRFDHRPETLDEVVGQQHLIGTGNR